MNKLFEGYDIKLDNMNTTSPDGFEKNIEKLSELFPNIVTDGKIDFEKLKLILGEKVENSEERYQFTWNGKSNAIREASIPSSDTLIPCPEEGNSKHWDTTQNIYIEGDNLRALKVLQNSYAGKIKMIYIDPPYNTGNDFVYNDDFALSIDEVEIQEGLRDKKGILRTEDRLSKNEKGSAKYHTNWLNMMYPRLSLARDLLTDDGVIFISIDENEVHNLKKICDEIFGEENFIGTLIWRKKYGGGQADENFVKEHEYILVIRKSSQFIWKDEEFFDNVEDYNREDEKGKYRIMKLAKWGNTARREDRPTMYFPIYTKTNEEVYPIAPDGNDGRWRVGKEKMNELITKDLLHFERKNNEIIAYEKIYFDNSKLKKNKFRSILYNFVQTADGSNALTNIFLKKDVFENPKPIELIQEMIKENLEDGDTILDFFSGSATTAHAVMKLNSEDNGNRKFIMVQLDEKTNNEEFPTICEIGKERIRRAGEKIKEEFEKTNQQLELGEEPKEFTTDIGFKVFKIDSTNFKEWETSYDYLEKSIKQSAKGEYTTYKTERTELDLVYEIILKQNFMLTEKLDIINTSEGNIYKVANGITYIFLNKVTTSIVDKIIELKREVQAEYGLENPTVILNEAYIDTGIKTNAIQNFKSNGITNIITV